VRLDEPSLACPRGGSPITIESSSGFVSLSRSIEITENEKILNYKHDRQFSVFFLTETSVSWTNIRYSSRVKISNFYKLFTSARVSNISSTNRSLAQKKRRTGNRVCDLKFFHFPFIKLY